MFVYVLFAPLLVQLFLKLLILVTITFKRLVKKKSRLCLNHK